jgi:hypothetical protein
MNTLGVAALLFCGALPGVAQTPGLAELRAKYPDADLAARELKTGVYEYSLLKRTPVGTIGVGRGGFSLQQDCMYCGKNIVFLGDMTSYVGVSGSPDRRSRIINVASLDYDPSRTDNPPLAALGVIALNETGIVKSDRAKTGLINWVSRLTFNDDGRSRTIFLTDITCWVNRGGDNWIWFSVGKAREFNSDGKTLGADVPVAVSLAHDGPNGRATVRVAERYAFHPSMKDDSTLVLLPE